MIIKLFELLANLRHALDNNIVCLTVASIKLMWQWKRFIESKAVSWVHSGNTKGQENQDYSDLMGFKTL
jgi:hypothetical protein